MNLEDQNLKFATEEDISMEYDNSTLIFAYKVPKSIEILVDIKNTVLPLMHGITIGVSEGFSLYQRDINGSTYFLVPLNLTNNIEYVYVLKHK